MEKNRRSRRQPASRVGCRPGRGGEPDRSGGCAAWRIAGPLELPGRESGIDPRQRLHGQQVPDTRLDRKLCPKDTESM
ncbi:MAG: hypothetical protein K6T94_26285 [Paenibacillus sp.]|nr:hypothetical protein [Paenibacillus sp.]